jgi:flagellar P-ring protein precursor FlgI
MTERINALYPGVAMALTDGRSIRVGILGGLGEADYISYLDSILELEIPTDNLARVVVNERTGVIVMGGDVRLRPGVITHSSIILTIAETPEVSQPGGFSQGETVVVPRTDLRVEEGDAPLVQIGGAVTLEQVVSVLNVLGASPRDMIAIMESLVNGGLLVAELRRL